MYKQGKEKLSCRNGVSLFRNNMIEMLSIGGKGENLPELTKQNEVGLPS